MADAQTPPPADPKAAPEKAAEPEDEGWLEEGLYELRGVAMRLKGRLFKHGDVVPLDEEQANRLRKHIKPAENPTKAQLAKANAAK